VKLNKTSERDVEQQRRAQEKDLRRQIEILKEEKEMLIAQLVEMDRVMQENQHLKKVLASKKRE
jgi:cell shape-determining protein MreC